MALAFVFVASGVLMLGLPSERLIESMAWAEIAPVPIVRLLGLVELLGAFALLIPTALHRRERVVGGVASGFVVLTLGLAAINVFHGELRVLPINIALAALSAFVAWGRGLHEERGAP